MTQIIDSTLATIPVSAEQTPADDFFIEVFAEAPSVFVNVTAKIEATAEYVEIDSYSAREKPIAKFRRLPFVKVEVTGNVATKQVKVWIV